MKITVYCLNYSIELSESLPTRNGEIRTREIRYLPEGALAVVIRVENEDCGYERIEYIWAAGMWRHASVDREPPANIGIYK